jgi:hypothetical protein
VAREVHIEPSGAIRPKIDGLVSSYFEWLGAGIYQVDERSGSMHGKQFLIKEVHYGTDGANLYVRLDFMPGFEDRVEGFEGRLNLRGGNPPREAMVQLCFEAAGIRVTSGPPGFECAWARVLEMRVPLAAFGVAPGTVIGFQFSLWREDLPVDAAPQHGWLEMATDPEEWGG